MRKKIIKKEDRYTGSSISSTNGWILLIYMQSLSYLNGADNLKL